MNRRILLAVLIYLGLFWTAVAYVALGQSYGPVQQANTYEKDPALQMARDSLAYKTFVASTCVAKADTGALLSGQFTALASRANIAHDSTTINGVKGNFFTVVETEADPVFAATVTAGIAKMSAETDSVEVDAGGTTSADVIVVSWAGAPPAGGILSASCTREDNFTIYSAVRVATKTAVAYIRYRGTP